VSETRPADKVVDDDGDARIQKHFGNLGHAVLPNRHRTYCTPLAKTRSSKLPTAHRTYGAGLAKNERL